MMNANRTTTSTSVPHHNDAPGMRDTHTVVLQGCAPEPLMHYLKALGVFRLVAQQKDATARARWVGDTFVLQSALSKDELVEFFLSEYSPTPVVSPWNGDSEFYKDNADALSIIAQQDSHRFQPWQETIEASRRILHDAGGITWNKNADRKQHIMSECRKRFPDKALDWLDAAYILTGRGPRYQPLLGTGGNDGRLEFSNNFMQNVVRALNLERQKGNADLVNQQIRGAMFAEGSPPLVDAVSGMYRPNTSGLKPNTSGLLTNPWDFVLMIEGVLVFAGAATRRLSAAATSKASFPFTVDSTAAGYGTSVESEYGDSARAEIWAPMWDNPATFAELEHLTTEGRAQLDGKQATNGSDFGRAVVGLGVERGISRFQRYGFLLRNGRNYLATPLGQFRTIEGDADGTSRRANLLFDLDLWVDRLRRETGGRDAPAGLASELSRIDGAILRFCQTYSPRSLQDVLIAVGHAHRWLARSRMSEKAPPLGRLSNGWAQYADDGSVEFRLALAMASVGTEPKNPNHAIGAIRGNLEPITSTNQGIQWDKTSVSCVWNDGDVIASMVAVLERRCLEGVMNNIDAPPLGGSCTAGLADITAFLNGRTDDQRIADLSLPLSCIRYAAPATSDKTVKKAVPPSAYAAMKMVLPSQKVDVRGFSTGETALPIERRLPSLLRAGRVTEAYQAAYRRLVTKGFRPISDSPGVPDQSEYGRRLAAALLFPVATDAYQTLAEYALLPADNNSGNN